MHFDMAVRFVFWLSVAALFYTYGGYPVLVFAIAMVRHRPIKRAAIEPHVTIIITAYNEERDLRLKLENTLSLEYPAEKLEVIVASDCSTDRTDEIALEFKSHGVRLHRQNERLGKTAAQNAAVETAVGEIIVFSDATTLYQKDVLRVLVPLFADPSVGCVGGRLIYVDHSDSAVGSGARSYWNYESFLKQQESRIFSLIGVSGCLYAVRRSAYVQMYHEACSDFLIATKMVEQGLRAVFEPNAVCMEETNRSSDKELRMRIRVITQTLNDLWQHRAMLNPFNGGFFSIQLLSHKLLRYLVPLFLIALLICSGIAGVHSRLFAALFLMQVLLYLSAAFGLALERTSRDPGIFAFPMYFALSNVASLIAMFKFLTGERYARWEPIRESNLDREGAVSVAGGGGEG
jgi:cellulose synthase/poly-beta-1,6-N-acetylglucosamine synthase-like glycosyltransferase